MPKLARESRRHNWLLAIGLLIIAGTAAVYISLMRAWLSGKKAAPVAVRTRPARDLNALAAARRHFRDNYVDPRAHARLAEALFQAGLHVDGFYVLFHGRRLFGPERFGRAHAFVALHDERHFLGTEEWDPSPENERRLKAKLEAEPGNTSLLQYLGRIAQARGDYAEARRYVETGLAADPSDKGLQLLRARLAVSGDPLQGVTHFARLINGSPDSWEAREALEDLARLAQGREDGPLGEQARLAREGLEELLKARPEDTRVFNAFALALWHKGDRVGARALVDETRGRREGHPGVKLLEGVMALQEHPEHALRLLTQAWEGHPDDLFTAAKLAQLYYRQRNEPEAALPFYIALYRRNLAAEDGEPVESIIRRALDERRRALLRPVGAEALGRFLRSDDASLRAEACVRAAELQDPRWLDAIGELLDDDTEIVRHNADYALYALASQHADALRVRRDQWLDPHRPLGKARALNLSAELWRQETYPLVTRALYDENAALRYYAKGLLDLYYGGQPHAQKAAADFLRSEKHPGVLLLLQDRRSGLL